MPLPLALDLPNGVHINGHFALEYESRRTLWQRENGGMKADWNKEVMAKIVAPLYARLLEDNTKKVDRQVTEKPDVKRNELQKHSRLFPSKHMKKQQVHIYIDVLHDALYQNISKKGLKVLPVTRPGTSNIEWHSTTSNVFFNNLHSCQSLKERPMYTTFASPIIIQKEPEPYQIVKSTLLEANFNLLKLPLSVHSSFTEAEVEVKLVNPEDVIKFFDTHSMKKKLPKPLGDSAFKNMGGLQNMITYCKQDKLFFNKLVGLPFLVTCDSELRVIDIFEEVYLSPYHQLVSNQQHRFVHWELLSFFTPPDPKQNSPFKMLTVQDLERLLKNDPQCTHMSKGMEVEYSREYYADWLHTLWQFLKEEASKVMEGSWQGSVRDEDRNRVRELLRPLASWSVYPVTRQGETSLFPLCKALAAIDLVEGDITSKRVRQIIGKINLPEPDYLVLCGSSTSRSYSSPILLAKILVASINNPAGVLMCFQELLPESTLDVLSVGEAYSLMEYFANRLDIIKEVPGVMSTLRKCPYYETVKGKLVSIKNNHGYIIPEGLPTADMDCWERTEGEVFLKSRFTLNKLYEFVGCVSLTRVEVYCSFILIQEHFEMMTEEGRNIHISYIRDTLLPNLESNKENEHARKALVEKLMALRFIPGPTKELHEACEFYDPSHPVFQAMKKEEHFPPAQFMDKEWLDFLRKIGMVNEVTVDMFLEFANTVAVDATRNPGDKETACQSKVLVEHLVEEFKKERSEWHEGNFVRTISKVNFIVPHRVDRCLRKLHPQFNEMKVDEELLYARYQDSIICGRIVDRLMWSSSVLIPAWAEPKGGNKHWLMESLGVSKTPTVDAVLDHLITLCKHLDGEINSKSSQTELVFDVLRNIYNFLNGHKSEHEAMKERLDSIKFLALEDGVHFVHARQVAVDILPEDEIYPYLFKFPLDFGEYADLFVNLGVNKKATAEQYAQVLEEIHTEIEGEKMHPEEMHMAVKAFIGLVEKTTEEPECLARCLQIFLPSRDKRLLRSNELIFNNDILLESRLCKLKKPYVISRWSFAGDLFNKAEINKLQSLQLSKFFKGLPSHLKCTNLEDGIEEIMEHQTVTGSEKHTDMAEEIKLKLGDPRFTQALLRLLRHQELVNGERKEETNPAEQEKQVKDRIVDGLGRLKIQVVEGEITTYMQYQGEKVEGSEEKCQMFHEKETDEDGNQQWVLYITNKPNYITDIFWTDLAERIDQLLDCRLGNSIVLLPLVLKSRMDDVSNFLDRRNVKPLLHTDNIPWFPSPGDPIPLQEHHLLLQDFLNFNEGEFIGTLIFLVLMFSNKLIAKTMHDESIHVFKGLETDDPILRLDDDEANEWKHEAPTLIHARVLREVHESEDIPYQLISKRYKVLVRLLITFKWS